MRYQPTITLYVFFLIRSEEIYAPMIISRHWIWWFVCSCVRTMRRIFFEKNKESLLEREREEEEECSISRGKYVWCFTILVSSFFFFFFFFAFLSRTKQNRKAIPTLTGWLLCLCQKLLAESMTYLLAYYSLV